MKIPHEVIDVSKKFEKLVIEDFLSGYNSGITPSPCVICDEKIKISSLIEYADLVGAEYIATGHYCDLEYSHELGKKMLKNAEDTKKDQTYMLYRLSEETLKRIKFPLYKHTKEEVRKIAEDLGLEVHKKKDSQGICFAPMGYKDYLKEKLGEKIKTGKFVDKNGNILGTHEGYQLYTVGQRRGLNLKLPKPYFIIKINSEKNQIVLGDYPELFQKEVELIDYKFVVNPEKLLGLELVARPRFSSKGLSGKIKISSEKKEEKRIFFEYNEETPQNAKGQHIVIYYGDFLVGGGIIK